MYFVTVHIQYVLKTGWILMGKKLEARKGYTLFLWGENALKFWGGSLWVEVLKIKLGISLP